MTSKYPEQISVDCKRDDWSRRAFFHGDDPSLRHLAELGAVVGTAGDSAHGRLVKDQQHEGDEIGEEVSCRQLIELCDACVDLTDRPPAGLAGHRQSGLLRFPPPGRAATLLGPGPHVLRARTERPRPCR